jgi:hypothetical protein
VWGESFPLCCCAKKNTTRAAGVVLRGGNVGRREAATSANRLGCCCHCRLAACSCRVQVAGSQAGIKKLEAAATANPASARTPEGWGSRGLLTWPARWP